MREGSYLNEERSTCAYVEDFAVFFDELGDDISEVFPVLVPVEFGGISEVMMSVTLRIVFPRRFVCRNGCSFRNTFLEIMYDLDLKFITSVLIDYECHDIK